MTGVYSDLAKRKQCVSVLFPKWLQWVLGAFARELGPFSENLAPIVFNQRQGCFRTNNKRAQLAVGAFPKV